SNMARTFLRHIRVTSKAEFMLVNIAERHWRKLYGISRLAQVIEGVIFKDGLWEDPERIAA
ncbi:MAG: hypothetical protein MN733_36810, partial [Nitrososphaera sp.]|nr:hypothetical protein [Nitrososphaera sp.]